MACFLRSMTVPILFGEENSTWGKPENRFFVPLPGKADYGAMMAVAYYVIGQIQKKHPPYFKENIESYVKEVSTIFKQAIDPIVS